MQDPLCLLRQCKGIFCKVRLEKDPDIRFTPNIGDRYYSGSGPATRSDPSAQRPTV